LDNGIIHGDKPLFGRLGFGGAYPREHHGKNQGEPGICKRDSVYSHHFCRLTESGLSSGIDEQITWVE
jgi:hypothetical protein